MLDVSIIICTHNGAKRIPAVLEALGRSSARSNVRWELVLVDNASTDGSGQVAGRIAAKVELPLRIVQEPELGLHLARRTGVRNALGRIISFLDDDNLADAGWVDESVRFFDEHPRVGAVGARVLPLFEVPASRPVDFDAHYARLLAIFDLGDEPKRIGPGFGSSPVGAGMTLRGKLARWIFLESVTFSEDRVGGKLSSGQDLEVGATVSRLGWELWYDPKLVIDHLLPPHRLCREYIDRLMIAAARSHAWLFVVEGKEPLERAHLIMKALLFTCWTLRYVLLICIPNRLDARLARRTYYRRLYWSKVIGYWHLLREFGKARAVFERITNRSRQQDCDLASVST